MKFALSFWESLVGFKRMGNPDIFPKKYFSWGYQLEIIIYNFQKFKEKKRKKEIFVLVINWH